MKKWLTSLVIIGLLLTGCVKDTREPKEMTIKYGEPFKFSEIEKNGDHKRITLNEVRIFKGFGMDEELQAIQMKKDAGEVLDTYEQNELQKLVEANSSDYILIDWTVENKTQHDITHYPIFVVLDANGLRTDIEIEYSVETPSLFMRPVDYVVTFNTNKLSPEHKKSGIFLMKIPEGTPVDKLYLKDGVTEDKYFVDLSGVEVDEVYKP